MSSSHNNNGSKKKENSGADGNTSKSQNDNKSVESTVSPEENEWLQKFKDNELFEFFKSITHTFETAKKPSENEEFLEKLESNADIFEIVKSLTAILGTKQKTTEIKKSITKDMVKFLDAMEDEDDKLLINLATKIKELPLSKSTKHYFVPRTSIKPQVLIASGSTTNVYFGHFMKGGTEQKVAIKIPKHELLSEMMKREAMVMSQFRHENVLKLIGLSNLLPEIIAIEFMELGNLNSALKTQPFSDLDLLKVLKDVATGMEYIHSKDHIHRDLACKNIFVNAQKQCKIGDFGRCVYVGYTDGEYICEKYQDGIHFALEHFPPEVFDQGIFSKVGDVWSMGILVWRMYDILKMAYSLIPFLIDTSAHEIVAFRNGHNRLLKPERCPENVWKFTLKNMLNRDRTKRPNFSIIRDRLEKVIQQKK